MSGQSSDPFPPGSSVAAYLRDSGGNNQDLSVVQQRAVVEGWCSEHGYILSQVFADQARPGGSTVGRDQFARMIEHFSNGATEAGVLFWDYSRLARNFDDGQFYISSLRRKGFKVYSLEQQIPPGSMGKVMESLHLWAAEEYRAELGRNVKRGLSSLVADFNAYPRPWVPPGYRKHPVQIGTRRDGTPHMINRLEPDPDRAPRVRLAYQLRAGGRSLSEIDQATRLFKWRQSYRYFFENEIYLGIFAFGNLRIENFCEPIVDADLWDQVQAINQGWKDHNAMFHPRRARSTMLLSGLARCYWCDYTLVAKRTKGHRYYECARNQSAATLPACRAGYIPADELEHLVTGRLLEYLSRDAYLQAIVDALRVELSRRPVEPSVLDDLRTKLAAAESAAQRIADALERAPASETLLKRLAELEGQTREYRAKLLEIESAERKREQAAAGLDIEAARRAALETKTRLEQPDFRSRQLALRALIRSIRVAKKRARPIMGEMTILLPGTDIETTISLD